MLFNYKEHRIFAFSDSHGMHKWLHILEEADILLCAGDVVSGFGKDGMEDFFSWLLSHPAKLYIFVAGNHELLLEGTPEQAKFLLTREIVFLHDTCYEFDRISFGNISTRSLQSKESNIHLAGKMDFLITHIPPEGILDEGRGKPSSFVRGLSFSTSFSCLWSCSFLRKSKQGWCFYGVLQCLTV